MKQVYKMFDRKTVGQSHIYLDQLPREAGGIHNMSFDNNGRLIKRLGFTKHNTGDLLSATKRITGLHRFYKVDTSTKYTLVVCDTVLYKLANVDPWDETSIKTGLTTGANMHFADFGNRCYFCNDEDGLFKFGVDTTSVRTVGPTAPVTKPTGVGGGVGGSLGVGNYKFGYTYVDEDGYESNMSPVSDAIDVEAGEKVTLTIVIGTDSKIVSRNFYRTALGGAIYYYDGEDANDDTSYVSSQADTGLGTQVSTKHDTAPTSPQNLVKRDNRIYLGDDAYLCISHISDVEYFPAGWFQRTPDRRKIKGLVEQARNLVVFTEDTISVLTGTDEDNFTFRKSFAGDGCIATRSIQNISNYIIFLSFNGLMAFNGSEIAEIDPKLSKYVRDNINYAAADTSCSCYYDDKYILSYPTNASHALGISTVPNESVYFDYKTGKTGVFSFAFNVFSRWDKGDDGIQIKGGSTTEGRVYNIFDGFDDDDSAIEFYDRTMPLDFGLPEVEKNFYDFYIKIKTTTGTDFKFYYTIDDNAEIYAEPITDEDLVADSERWYRVRLPEETRGRSIAPRPWMEDAYQAEFQGYIIVYDTEPLRV